MATRRSARLVAMSELVSSASATPAPALAAEPSSKKRKTTSIKTDEVDDVPSTPTKRRARLNEAISVPATPPSQTPGPFGFGASPLKKPRTPAVTRLADPRSTNAPLISPMTSRIVAPKPADGASPSKTPGPRTTSANLLEEACAHLISVDARMKPLVEKYTCSTFTPERLSEKIDPFACLAGSIISQQVSGAAAKTIEGRFKALFDGAGPGRYPQPAQVAPCSIETLRSAGLSQRKAEYIKGLAEKFCSGELSAQLVAEAPYEELVERLVAVRGLGLWSVEMFAMFGLKRMDVFSVGDLGVQRGMAAFVGRDVAKLKSKGGKWKYMSEKEMKEISEKFTPYRSLFMWYMWQILETDVSTMEKPS